METSGFELWLDGQVIHREDEFEDIKSTQDLYEDVKCYWESNKEDERFTNINPVDILVKIWIYDTEIEDGDEEELTLDELL